MNADVSPAAFIERWSNSGAAERANYAMFLSVIFPNADDITSTSRIRRRQRRGGHEQMTDRSSAPPGQRSGGCYGSGDYTLSSRNFCNT